MSLKERVEKAREAAQAAHCAALNAHQMAYADGGALDGSPLEIALREAESLTAGAFARLSQACGEVEGDE